MSTCCVLELCTLSKSSRNLGLGFPISKFNHLSHPNSSMEASNQGGLLNQIVLPRLEDAGLEDCALPPDSIAEAFHKAAAAVKSSAVSIFTSDFREEGNCVEDPWPATSNEPIDALVGISPGNDPPAPCSTEKGSAVPEVGEDELVVGGEERADDIVVGEEKVKEGEKACVDGMHGLEIGDKGKKIKNVGDAEQEKDKTSVGEKERPILAGGFA